MDRHALLTFSGTWAPPGVGYPSDVAHAVTDVCEEIPVQAPWSFGPIPPGDFHAPSYQESVQIAVNWSVDYLLRERRTFLFGGYSQGGEAASRVKHELRRGGRLESVSHLYVGGFAFGNPSRQMQHTYYAGPPTPFDGIAKFRLTNTGNEWCELAEPGDLYTTSARGLTGEIERDVYSMCVEMQMHSGFTEFCATLVANMIEVVKNLDGDAYDDLQRAVTRHGVDLSGARVVPREWFNPLTTRLLSIEGIAAAIAAAIDGLIFFCAPPFPTAAHCEYHVREVWPGQTYLGLAIQHVNDWANRVQPVQETA